MVNVDWYIASRERHKGKDILIEYVACTTLQTQITILSSHPLIGASATNMSAASQAEQQASSNGEEDAETRAVLARLNILNKAYSDKFGFPFIVFVNGRSKAEIVPVFEQRLQGTRADELRTACTDYIAIARSRLAKVVAAASSL
eukprot:m.79404 g.79404  ORF g.79404 m.79404 type:complete len:145 (-) comp16270_c0_seq1:203-637(-)